MASPPPATGTPLPPGVLGRAANVARWFPELLMTLGAPDLEQNFHPICDRLVEHPHGRVFEVVLQGRTPSAFGPYANQPLAGSPLQSAAPQPAIGALDCPVATPGGAETVQRLERLASSIELLAARLAVVPSPQQPMPPAPVPARVVVEAAPPVRLAAPRVPAPAIRRVSDASTVTERQNSKESKASNATPAGPAQRSASKSTGAVVTFARPEEEEDKEKQAPPKTVPAQPAQPAPAAPAAAVSPAGSAAPPRATAEKEKDPTPRSARGEKQVRQGNGEGKNHSMGRSRRTSNVLSIAVTKEEKLTDAPMSPKMGPRQVWGRSASKATNSGEIPEFRSPEDTKERINSKFKQLFGDPNVLSRSASKTSETPKTPESSSIRRRHSVS